MKELIEKAIQINEELVAKLKEMKITELFKNEIALFEADDKYFTCEVDGVKTKGYISIIHAMGGYVIEYCTLRGSKLPIDVNSEKPFNAQMIKDLNITNLKLWDYLPEEGDYFYVKSRSGFSYIAIAKNGKDLTSRFVSLNKDNGKLNYNESWFICPEPNIKELRSATTEEITLLDTILKKDGKYFDQATMSIKAIVNEPAFKVGDWVLITKPKDVIHDPVWSYYMDKYDGQTLEIEEINSDGYLVIDEWEFNPDWCTKVEAPKPKVGDLCILWDNNKSNAIIGKLTSIDKSDFPYGVAFILDYKNCIKFESMEQYNEFIKG